MRESRILVSDTRGGGAIHSESERRKLNETFTSLFGGDFSFVLSKVYFAHSVSAFRIGCRWFTHIYQSTACALCSCQNRSLMHIWLCPFDNNNSFACRCRRCIGPMCFSPFALLRLIALPVWMCWHTKIDAKRLHLLRHLRPIYTCTHGLACRYSANITHSVENIHCWSVRHENIIYVRTGWSWKHNNTDTTQKDGRWNECELSLVATVSFGCLLRLYTATAHVNEHKMPEQTEIKIVVGRFVCSSSRCNAPDVLSQRQRIHL